MADNSRNIINNIKEFMFGENLDETNNMKNNKGKNHGLEFVTWADEQCFIIKDSKGDEYRIRVSKELD
jgi:hypothetical protein